MKQDKTAELIMADLVKNDLVSPENYDAVFPFIEQAYGVGYDKGRSMHVVKKPIVQLNPFGMKIAVFESASVAANKCGVAHSSISNVTSGRRKTAGGYKWIYLEDYQSIKA